MQWCFFLCTIRSDSWPPNALPKLNGKGIFVDRVAMVRTEEGVVVDLEAVLGVDGVAVTDDASLEAVTGVRNLLWAMGVLLLLLPLFLLGERMLKRDRCDREDDFLPAVEPGVLADALLVGVLLGENGDLAADLGVLGESIALTTGDMFSWP